MNLLKGASLLALAKSIYYQYLRLLRKLSNNNGDDNDNGKKVIGLLSKTKPLHVHHAFLYFSLQSLHDYD